MSKGNFVEIKGSKEISRIISDATKTLNMKDIEIEELTVVTIATIALEETIKYVKETGKTINFMQILDFALEDGEVLAAPGQEFKLLVKSDEKSEEE